MKIKVVRKKPSRSEHEGASVYIFTCQEESMRISAGYCLKKAAK